MPERPTNLDNSRARNSCLSAHYGCFSHFPPISQLLVIPSHNEVGEEILGLSHTYVCTYETHVCSPFAITLKTSFIIQFRYNHTGIGYDDTSNKRRKENPQN